MISRRLREQKLEWQRRWRAKPENRSAEQLRAKQREKPKRSDRCEFCHRARGSEVVERLEATERSYQPVKRLWCGRC